MAKRTEMCSDLASPSLPKSAAALRARDWCRGWMSQGQKGLAPPESLKQTPTLSVEPGSKEKISGKTHLMVKYVVKPPSSYSRLASYEKMLSQEQL